MNILTISTFDRGSGAEKVAFDLHQGYILAGHNARMVVKYQRENYQNVYTMPRFNSKYFMGRLQEDIALKIHLKKQIPGRYRLIEAMAATFYPNRMKNYWSGSDNYYNPFVCSLLEWDDGWLPDLIHCHNLHGNYFDLSYLPYLTSQVPIVETLHDTWLLAGHCAYFIDCQRWREGCGNCPDLQVYPAIIRDRTRRNFAEKRKWLGACSDLHLVGPSEWICQQFREGGVPCTSMHCIHNGVDLSTYYSESDKGAARKRLNLPLDKFVVLGAVTNNNAQNKFKDYLTINTAIREFVNEKEVEVLCILVGRANINDKSDKVMYPGLITDPAQMADYYRAADVFVHAAAIDNFPCTILEAQACGTPVIATAVGGIPEQIVNNKTGFLVGRGDNESMINKMNQLLNDRSRCLQMGTEATRLAKEKFDLGKQRDMYLDLFHSIVIAS